MKMTRSGRKKNTHKKLRLLTVLLSTLTLFFVGFYLFQLKANDQTNGQQEPDKTNPIDQVEPSTSNQLIEQIFTLSKDRMIPNISFVSGKTKKDEVIAAWGETNQISETVKGRYESYENHHSTIGYIDNIVIDLRSDEPEIQKIKFHDIKKIGGEPDDIRYYKDSAYDQMILVYKVNPSTELLWVLPRETDQDSNPNVHHISLYTQLEDTSNRDYSLEYHDVTEIISNMTLEEKIGQMIVAGISGTGISTDTEKLLSLYHVGGIIFYKENLETPSQITQLINQLKDKNHPNLPLLLSIDQEGGSVTRLPGGLVNFPTNEEIGKLNNPEFSYQIGSLLGYELKEFGFNLNFAPVLDINSNPNNPVIGNRSFGNHPDIVSSLGIQTMKGIQSQNVIPTIKHFPGHGDTSVDSHLDLPIVDKSLSELKKLELIPFERAINQGADVVMVAHILLPQLDKTNPASMSKAVITDLLRDELNFTGVIITDDMTMGAITGHFDIEKAAVQSVKAGSDLILVGHDFVNVEKIFSVLKTAVHKGVISEQRINESVERIIQLKKEYSINEAKVDIPNIDEINQVIKQTLNKY